MKIRKIIGLAMACMMIGCTEESFEYQDATDIAMFALETETFVASDAIEDNVIELYIASPVRMETDRTYLVQVMSKGSGEEAEENEQFELASSAVVTIPAGELTGSFQVRAWSRALSELEDVVAYFSLSAIDEEHPVAGFNNEMSLVLARTCGFSPEKMAGKVNISTTLVPGDYESGVLRKVKVETDPAVDNGFIVKEPYAEGVDLHMKMWITERGNWNVEMADVYLTRVVPEDPREKPYDVYGYGRGIWYPCMKSMVMIYYLHLLGDEEVIGMVYEMYEKQD